ncbi:MAG: DUF4157 domain-containing protein [Acidobacteria bacterium]|nr:DUF4157 domain-containing protein [Acidobacteriota bacterium]
MKTTATIDPRKHSAAFSPAHKNSSTDHVFPFTSQAIERSLTNEAELLTKHEISHDFSSIPVVSETETATDCSLGLIPTRCPFGGVCNICPAHVQAKRTLGIHTESATDNNRSEIPLLVHEVLNSRGEPLGEEIRKRMERFFRQDFGLVRIHTDHKAAESAWKLGALAYTVGSDIVFGAGRYAPDASEGRRLLAHELAHTVQQGEFISPPNASLSVSRECDSCEQEAESVATTAKHALESAMPTAPACMPVEARHSPVIQRMSSGVPRGNAIVSKNKIDYDLAVNAGKYCLDTGITGLFHRGQICYREVPPRKRYMECPPGDQVCFDTAGKFLADSYDLVSPVEKQNPDKTCNLHFFCSLGHGAKDVLPYLFSGPGKGGLTGGGIGLLTGAAIGGIFGPLGLAIGAGAGALLGAGVGALIGWLREK